MSLSTTANKVIHNGNASATSFSYTFPIPSTDDLVVIYTDTEGVETTLTPAQFSVTGIGTPTGGAVTYPLTGSPIALDTLLTILRTVDQTQPTVLSNQGGYFPEVVELALDRITMIAQQIYERAARSFSAPLSDPDAPTDMPSTEQRANGGAGSFLAFDSLGNAYAATLTGLSGVSAFIQNNFLPAANAAAARTAIGAQGTADIFPLLRSHIWGWAYANNVADATNDIDIPVGAGADATGAYWISGAALTKRLDAAWAVGTNQGGLDTGSIGNSEYYIWAIARSDTGVVDYLFSLSSTAPTMPPSYDFKRLIGWFKRSGGAILPFKVHEISGGGIDLAFTTPIRDINLANTLNTTRRTDALSVPKDFSVEALVRVQCYDAGAQAAALVGNPDETVAAVGTTDTPLANNSNLLTSARTTFERYIRTSATGTIYAVTTADVTTMDNYVVVTCGFKWSRR